MSKHQGRELHASASDAPAQFRQPAEDLSLILDPSVKGVAAAPSPVDQQLQEQLRVARERIAELTLRLEQVEGRSLRAPAVLPEEKALCVQVAQPGQVVEALRHTEERYRLIAQSTNDAIWDYDYATDHLEYNARFVELFGRAAATGSEALRQWHRHIHPDDQTRVVVEHERFLESGEEVLDLKYRIRLANGEYAHVRDRTVVRRDEHGRPRRLVGSNTDMTAEVRAREALEAELLVRCRAEQMVRAHAALTLDTLRSIAREPTLEAFIGQVLKTIVDELGGVGGTFSIPGPEAGTIVAYLHYQDGRVLGREELDHPFRTPRRPVQPHGPWTGEFPEPEILTPARFLASEDLAPYRAWLLEHGVKTGLQIPIHFGADGYGALAVRFAVERQFDRDELELVKALALQGALAMRLARLSEAAQEAAAVKERENAARQRAQELGRTNSALQRTLSKLVSAEDLQPLLVHILREVTDIAQAVMAMIALYDESSDTLAPAWCVRHGEPIDMTEDPWFGPWRAPVPASAIKAWRRITDAGSYAWFSYAAESEDTPPYALEWHRAMGHRSLLAVPLLGGSGIIGFLSLFFDHDASAQQERIELARVFAHEAAAALQLTRLAEQARAAAVVREREQAAREKAAALEAEVVVRRRAEQMVRAHAALITNTLRSITREPSLQAFIGQVLKTIVDELRGMGGTLSLPGPVPGTVVAYLLYEDGRFVRGEASDHPSREPQRPPHLSAWTTDCAEAEILDEQYLSTSPDFAPFREWAHRRGVRTVLQVPLLFGGEAVGVLAVRFPVRRQFVAEELQLVKALALQGTLAVRLTQVSEDAKRAAALHEREQTAQRRVSHLERALSALQRLWKLGSVRDLKPLMEYDLREVGSVAQAVMATIFLYEERTDALSLAWCVCSGEPIDVGTEPGFEVWRSSMPASLDAAWHKVNETKGHAWLSFAEPTSHTSPYSEQWHLSMGHRSMLAAPLLLGEQRLGYLALFFAETSPPSPERRELARAFAYRATSAIHMARLGEQAQSAAIMREREKAAQDKAAALETVNQLLRTEISERQRAEQLLRSHASVISSGLRSLTLQPSLEGFTRQCLKTIVEQLGGMGGALWMPVDSSQQIRLFLNYQSGSFERGEESLHPHRDAGPFPLRVSDLLGRTTLEPLVLTREDINRDADASEIEWWERLAIRTALLVPLAFGDESLGALTVRFADERRFSAEELDLAKVLAHQATLSAQLAQLSEQGRKSAVLEERARVARDIHDTLAQGFTGVIVQLEAATAAMLRALTDNATRHIERAGELARHSLAEARRSVHALKALALEQAEFGRAFKELLERMTSETGIDAEFRLHGVPRPLPPECEQELFHIGQEALTNAMRHAQASRFAAVLTYEDARVVFTLRDDGVGFDPAAALGGGIGLIGMHERASAVGAELKVTSAPGKGTEIMVLLDD